MKTLGRGRHLVQHAVNAVFDLYVLLEGLYVDVTGTGFNGLDDDEVNKVYDRRLSGHFLELMGEFLFRGLGELRGVEVGNHTGDAGAVDTATGFKQLDLGTVVPLNPQASQDPEQLHD